MSPIRIALIASLLISVGCPHRIVLPDDSQVHQLAADADVTVWCHGPEADSWTKCKVRATRGFWIVPPTVADGR